MGGRGTNSPQRWGKSDSTEGKEKRRMLEEAAMAQIAAKNFEKRAPPRQGGGGGGRGGRTGRDGTEQEKFKNRSRRRRGGKTQKKKRDSDGEGGKGANYRHKNVEL